MFLPISCHWSFSIPPEIIRKAEVLEWLNHIHSILTVDVWTKIQATTTMMETMTMKSKKAHYTNGLYLITDLTQFMEQTWEITYD